MKKLMKVLSGKKGFTLIECVIAIAVFAALTGMVLMIMSQTIQLSKKSSDAETDLNNLVENVVQDSTKKTYGDDSRTLNMKFGSENFSMTYSTVDGYKNFIECTNVNCKNHANNLDYMSYIYETNTYKNASDSEKESYKISYWFDKDTTTNYYECPKCQQKIQKTDLTMRCLSCGKQGNSTAFDFNKFSGSYTCPDCFGGNVVQLIKNAAGNDIPITESPTADADFMISGMVSNAIRYGEVPQFDETGVKDIMAVATSDSSDPKFTTDWTYTPNKNASIPGVYTLNLSITDPIASGETASVSIKLPGGYLCSILKTGTNADGTGTNPYASFIRTEDISLTDKPSLLMITGITDAKKTNIKVSFYLTNYKNNNSFDSDYPDTASHKYGLAHYWFAIPQGTSTKSFSVAYPRTDSSITIAPQI